MDGKLVCIGHSHAAALQRAAAIGNHGMIDAINFWDTGEPWLHDGGKMQLRQDLAERVALGQQVLSLIGGSAHTVLGMVEHARPFDFVLPDDPNLPVDERREIVPAEAVRAKLADIAAPYLQSLPAILAVANGPVRQIEPPPPIADQNWIAPLVPWVLFPGQPRKVAPKWLRYKLWRMHSAIIQSACAALGIGYLPAPRTTMDAEGFLAAEFDEDGAHANGAYGAQVLNAARQST